MRICMNMRAENRGGFLSTATRTEQHHLRWHRECHCRHDIQSNSTSKGFVRMNSL